MKNIWCNVKMYVIASKMTVINTWIYKLIKAHSVRARKGMKKKFPFAIKTLLK